MRRSQTVLRLLFWAAALFALVMALLPRPPAVPVSDKLQHAAAFATLGLLGSFAYGGARKRWLIIGLSLFGAFIELAQAIPALHRDSDPIDWIADTVACAAVVLVLRWWKPRHG